MSDKIIEHNRVLAIDPANRGFGYAVLEGPNRLIDWGVKEVRDNSNERCLAKIKELIDIYQPDVIVVEDFTGKDSRRCHRVQGLIKDIIGLASEMEIKTCSFSRSEVREVFSQSDVHTKHEIASVIAEKFPELSMRLPPERKCYMPEDYRMAIFDAMSFAVAFYYFKDKREVLTSNKSESYNDILCQITKI